MVVDLINRGRGEEGQEYKEDRKLVHACAPEPAPRAAGQWPRSRRLLNCHQLHTLCVSALMAENSPPKYRPVCDTANAPTSQAG